MSFERLEKTVKRLKEVGQQETGLSPEYQVTPKKKQHVPRAGMTWSKHVEEANQK